MAQKNVKLKWGVSSAGKSHGLINRKPQQGKAEFESPTPYCFLYERRL